MKKVPTVLFVLTMTASGFANVLRAPNVVEVASRLGYPVYIASILGVWKLLGVLAIGTAGIHKMPRLREWAYVGFFFDLSGAILSDRRRTPRRPTHAGAASCGCPLCRWPARREASKRLGCWRYRPDTPIGMRLRRRWARAGRWQNPTRSW